MFPFSPLQSDSGVLAQNGSRASPSWVLHIDEDWGEFPPFTVKHFAYQDKALYKCNLSLLLLGADKLTDISNQIYSDNPTLSQQKSQSIVKEHYY